MKSRISVECSALNEDESDWTHAVIIIERLDHPDQDSEEAFQVIEMTRAEFEAVYTGMWIGRNEGKWTIRTVDDEVA